MKSVFWLLMVGVVLTGCKRLSERNASVQVTNGMVADPRVVAEGVVRLRSEFMNGGRGFRSTCTGTLIHMPDSRLNSCVVVSAAHCFKDAPKESRHTVEFISEKGVVNFSATAKAIHVHPLFNANGTRVPTAMSAVDVSLVEFSCEKLTGVRPAKILDYQNAKVGTNLIIAGYGLTTSEIQAQINKQRGLEGASTEATMSDVLMQTEMRLRRVEFLSALAGQMKDSEPGIFLLSGTGGRSSCNGDSGGPAFLDVGQQLYLVATTSAGSAQCERSSAVYTISSPLVGWMNQILGAAVIKVATAPSAALPVVQPSVNGTVAQVPPAASPSPTQANQPGAKSSCSGVSLKVKATTREWGTIVKLRDRDSTQISDVSLKCNLKNDLQLCLNERPRPTGTGNSTAVLIEAIDAQGCGKFARGERVYLFSPDFIRAE